MMKKTIAFLFAALAVLSASAKFVYYLNPQYRIGDGIINNNDGRIVLDPANGAIYDATYTNCTLYTTIPAGQQFSKWWYYYPTTSPSVETTNTSWVVGATNCNWVYNSNIKPYVGYNINIVADFDYITYTLNYNANTGSGTMSSESHVYTNNFNLAANKFTKTGYTFAGWTNSVVKSALGNGAQITSGSTFGVTYTNKTSTLYAKWTVNTYTVTLDRQSGTGGSSSVAATYDAAMPAISKPTRTGYTFGGYYDQANGGGTQYYKADGSSARSWNKTVAATLYAKWTANAFAVTLDNQDGTGGASSVTATYDSAMPAAAMPTRTGYTFGGYYDQVNGNGTQYYNENGSSARSWNKTVAATLYAKWTAKTYTVELDSQNGMGGTAYVTATYGSSMPQAQMPTRAGYVFDGYYSMRNGGGTKYYDANGSSARNWDIDSGSPVLYANWISVSYTVTLDQQGGTGGSSSVEVNYGAAMPAVDVPTRTGYSFGGYYTAADGGGMQYYASNGSSARPWDMTASTTLYAKWTAEKYTVTLDKQGGTGGASSVTATYDSAMPTAAMPTRTGYTFGGYYDQVNGTGTQYYSAEGSSASTWNKAEPTDLYAYWLPIEYTIEFDGNGAESGSVASIAAEYDKAYDLPDNGFSKSGQGFKGWRLGNATYDAGTSVSNLTTQAGDTVKFYAVWSEPRYISFNGNGATATNGVVEVVEFEGIETKTLPVNVFGKTGYTFSGWATNETDAAALSVQYNDGAEVSSANLAGAIGETNEFFAVWTTNAYTVAFNPNCKKYTGEMQPQGFVYDQAQNLTANAFVNETGLHFSGWSNTVTGVTYSDGAAVSNLTAEANGTVTLNAIWDNGELSRAMHCDNLYWTNAPQYDTAVWTPTFQHGVGCQSDSAAVSVKMLSYMVANVHTNGILRFKWKSASKKGPTVFSYIGSYQADRDKIYEPRVDEEDETVWHDSGDIEIPSTRFTNGALTLGLRFTGKTDELTMYIDQLTWTPADASVEPTEDDKPVISGFAPAATESGSGFRIQISNASNDFDYQILGTDDLTTTEEWPVIETLSGSEMNEGYTIEFDEDEPKMFYKVKVISK